MDRKSLLILAVAIMVLFLLSPVVDHYFPATRLPADSLAMSTNQPAATNAPAGAGMPTPGAPGLVSTTTAPAPQPSLPEQILNVTNEDLVYHYTSHGGGIKGIELRDYPAMITRSNRAPTASNVARLNREAPAPILAILGEGGQGEGDFTLTRSNTTVRAEKTLTNGLRVVKEFDIGSTGTNFLFTAKVWLMNASARPLRVGSREVVIGTATPIGPLDDPSTVGAMWYNGAKVADVGASWFANYPGGCACFPARPRPVFEEGASNVVWAAVHNQFFVLAAIPAEPAPGVVIRKVEIAPPDTSGVTNNNTRYLTNGFETAFAYPARMLAPGQTLEQSFTFYAGPKEYKGLAKIAQRMDNNLDLVMGFNSFFIFGFFSKMLLLSMNGLSALGLGYGWAIIAITVIIKAVFWPMTAASTRSQKRLQALQPQLTAIAEKYKGDAMKKHEKTQEFMKEHKVNPLGSCLPMLIQIPVFMGFYSMLRNSIELRGVSFLWAFDLSQPDTVATIAGIPVNPLPLIMGVSQLWQAQLTPPSPGMDPGQQKIMRYMPVLFIAMFYRMSAGLTVYWTVSNLLTIAQTKLTKMNAGPGAKPAPAVAVVPRKKK